MKILYLRNLYWPEDFGGNRYAYEVTRRLSARGHSVSVLTGCVPGDSRPSRNGDVEVSYFPVWRGHPVATHLSNVACSLPALERIVRSTLPDVAIIASYDVALSYSARRVRPPSVYIYHSSFYAESVERLRRFGPAGRVAYRALRAYTAAVERRVFGHADRIIAVSGFSRDEIVARCPSVAPRVSVIPTGVDTQFFVPPVDKRAHRLGLGIPSGSRVAVVVGRLTRVKRYDRAIAAIARLREQGAAADLLVVGDGPERQPLEAQAVQLGVGHAVHFLGFRSGERLREALQAADVQLCSSEFENLSLALLEGLSCGVPVVALPTGGTVGLLSAIDSRLLADGTNSEALATRAGELMSDAEWRATASKRGRDYVIAEHDWESVVDRVEQIAKTASPPRT